MCIRDSYNYDAANLTVSNSRFSVNAAEDGGAIFNELVSVLTLGNTSFSANEASDDGGAIYNDDGLVVSTRNIYSGNIAADGGGVLFNASNGNVTLDGDSLALNEAGGRGGAADNFGTLSLDGTTITSNTAVDGGAIASARQLDVTGNPVTGSGGSRGLQKSPTILFGPICVSLVHTIKVLYCRLRIQQGSPQIGRSPTVLIIELASCRVNTQVICCRT